MTLDDAFDLTPALAAEARARLSELVIGPAYTPPSAKGTIIRPGITGGANWGGGAIDPRTGTLFVKTSFTPNILRLVRPSELARVPPASDLDAEWIGQSSSASFADSLPLTKPPYAHLTAIDLNQGTIKWQVPFGDSPAVREHPALAGVKLPDRLGAPGPAGVLVTAAGLIFGGGGDAAMQAFDSSTGRELWRMPLPRRVVSTPMTYRTRNGRQLIVVSTGGGEDAVLMAFGVTTDRVDP